MSTTRSLTSGAVVLSLLFVPAANAYEHPLDSTSIREAYFLGQRSDEKTAKFLAQYVKRLPLPKRGPHVAEIEFRTPYAQVVLRSRQHSVGYSAQQAEESYAAHPDRIVVRVQIHLTPTYGALLPTPPGSGGVRFRPSDFWRDFSFQVVQGKAIEPKTISGTPIYDAGFHGSLTGAEVLLEFSAAQLRSAPVRVEVISPDGQHAEAEFDLRDLR